MIVDARESDLWFLSEVARTRGHVVVACKSGKDALASFAKELPDIVLLDLALPGLGGAELCRRLRALPKGERPFVIAVTAEDDPAALRDVLAAGADDFVVKPAEADLISVRLGIAEKRVARQHALRRAEADLDSRTRELETLFANVHDVFFSVDVTETRLIQASPATRALFGHDPDALAGDDALWKSFLLPPRPGDPDPWATLREAGPSTPLVTEYAVRAADGAERWVRISLQVRPDRERGGLRADGVVSDITDEHRGRRQLAESNRELAALYRLSELTIGASTLDEAYNAMLAVVTEVMGWPVAGVEHVDVARDRLTLTAAHGVDVPPDVELEAALSGSISQAAIGLGGPVIDVGSAAVRARRSLPWLPTHPEAHVAFPLAAGGRAFGVLFLAHTEPVTPDETFLRLGSNLATTVAAHVERLEAEEALRDSESRHRTLAHQLKQANEELESFAYSVSHDLRSPLRTMQGFAHALLQEYAAQLPSEARDFLRRIIASGQQLEELIGDLLAYSRLSFEELELRGVDLEAVVDAALDQVRADLDNVNGRIDVVAPLPPALGHHTTLVQILVNLLSNAIKFVPPGRPPRVTIRAATGEERVRLWIEDNGIGVPRGQEERVFRAFERLGERGERPGTGIGLAIVRRGIQRIGGASGVEPREEGGSAFWIEVPGERRRAPRRRGRRG